MKSTFDVADDFFIISSSMRYLFQKNQYENKYYLASLIGNMSTERIDIFGISFYLFNHNHNTVRRMSKYTV